MNRPAAPHRPHLDLNFFLIAGFWLVLLAAGGASRADVLGQLVVRFSAWMILIALTLSNRLSLPSLRNPSTILLLALTVIMLIQLTPLPSAIWLDLPYRSMFAGAASVAGKSQPWRPITISPSATINSLGSLIVPWSVLLLIADADKARKHLLLNLILFGSGICALVGILQLAGVYNSNPFINDSPEMISGTFANRNHFALFLALGCLFVPVWALNRSRGTAIICFGAELLLLLLILLSGSRMGAALGAFGLIAGLTLVAQPLTDRFKAVGRRAKVLIVASVAVVASAVLLLAAFAGRAVSLERFNDMSWASDLRFEALPTVWAMTRAYFPFGIGFGAFDPVYRIWEPVGLLQPAYFNHAHNDLLEIVLEAGAAGVIISSFAILCWARWTFRAFFRNRTSERHLARAGSIALLMLFCASLVDYPLRTPIVMVVAIFAAALARGASSKKPARCDG